MRRARNVLVVSAAAFLFCLGSADDAESASNGINALIAVAQQKADQANSDALEAAKKQRSLIKKTKDKSAQARLNELAKLHPCRLPGEQRLEPLTLLTKTFQLMHEFTRHRRMISPLHHCLK